jgi:hypothetical protein
MRNPSNGIGILGLLFVIFITLKVCNIIDWSWCMVFLPVWIGLGLGILAFILAITIIVVGEIKNGRH